MPNTNLNVLTDEQIELFKKNGFLSGFQVFGGSEIVENEAGFQELVRQLMPGEPPNSIKGWEKTSAFIFHLAVNPKILDYVADVLGPDVLLWGTQFICKYPGDATQSPWHQDARYWPLTPHETVTVCLALDDADEDNSGISVVPGSHTVGLDEIDPRAKKQKPVDFHEGEAKVLRLKVGQIAIYDDNIIHATSANRSNRRRAALIIHYCTPRVKCDLDIWPSFSSTVARGKDTLKLNPSWDASDIYMAAS
jgi:ectoine hydroxylase-related dioxygenase (phytanoyl-CoA dioxygenase family)